MPTFGYILPPVAPVSPDNASNLMCSPRGVGDSKRIFEGILFMLDFGWVAPFRVARRGVRASVACSVPCWPGLA